MVADAMFPNVAETTEIEDIAVAPVTLVGAMGGIPRRLPMLKLMNFFQTTMNYNNSNRQLFYLATDLKIQN